MNQLPLFSSSYCRGMVTGRPIPQSKAELYPLLIEPDHPARQNSFWRYSKETKSGWLVLIVRAIGYGSFNGPELLYCELADGSFQEFGPYALFPATKQEISKAWTQHPVGAG